MRLTPALYLPLRVRWNRIARRGHGDDEERGFRNHYCAGWVSGRVRVHGGPDSVGRSSTSAVVKSTFLVIVEDAIFTALFYLTGK